jgi:electron transport complex protein RnfB
MLLEFALPRDYNENMIPQNIPSFPVDSPYRLLARSLDALPHRFPPAEDESDLHLLAKIFTLQEAELAANLLPDLESPAGIANRLGRDLEETTAKLKEMAKKGLIAFGKTDQGRAGFGLLPFVVGIYEDQLERLDGEMASLFEKYYHQAFGMALAIKPQVHRVVPVRESIKNTLEVRPFESASGLIENAQSWGVVDCICRKQKALIGEPCKHPVDVCMVLSQKPGAFAGDGTVHALTQAEAHDTLQRAADAGLVHCVSNNQRDLWYICNCCTCSCAILRGMVDLGIANVVARSAFIIKVDPEMCIGCGDCLPFCDFGALSMDFVAEVLDSRCVGCGICVPACPMGAHELVRRSGEADPPLSEHDWREARKATAEQV